LVSSANQRRSSVRKADRGVPFDSERKHSLEDPGSRGRRQKLIIALLAISLVLLASFAFLNLAQPIQTHNPTTTQQSASTGPVSILNNHFLFFGSVSGQGRTFRAGEWNLTIRNSSDKSANITVALSVNGQGGGGTSFLLGPMQTYSNITALPLGLSENETLAVSVFAFTSSGLHVLNSTATTQVAQQVAEPGAITVGDDKIDSSFYSVKYNASYSEWTLTVTNSGTKPIALLMASLYNSTGYQMGSAYSYANGNFLDSNKSYTPFPTVTRPMSPGQSASLFKVILPKLSGGSYIIAITALYIDGTQSTTQTSVNG